MKKKKMKTNIMIEKKNEDFNKEEKKDLDNNKDDLDKKNTEKNLINTLKQSNYNNNKLRLSAKKKNNILGSFETAEENYQKIRPIINDILKSQNESSKILIKENKKMQNLLLNLNNIVSLMTKNIKIDIPKYKPLNEEKIDLNENNEKIINRYKNEYEILNKRYEQLKDEKYINNLEKKKDTIIKNLNNLKREIKDLKNEQKMKSIIMTKELKNSKLKLIKTQRVETEYNNLKLKYNNLCNQRERNEQVKKDNEAKLEELKQFKNKIEEMGKEMYDIKEFINVNESNQLEKNKVILKNSLDKKLNIIDGAFIIHKNKYEKEISIREKKIFEKEKEKLKLLKEMRYETIRNEKLIGKIKELYEPIEHLNDENEENLTQHNKGIFIELAKKEKEKEELLKEKTLLKKELEDLIKKKKINQKKMKMKII